MKKLALILLIGCATLPHAPVEREDEHASSYGSGGGVFIHNVAKTILAQPIPVVGSGGPITATDITAQHFYTSLTGATGVVFGPATTHGLGFDTSSQSLLFLSGSAEQWRISGATGDLVSSAGIDRNIDTGGIYKSRQASGSNAFQIQTNGARIDFGAGANDYASSDGTTISFAAPISVGGAITSGAGVTIGTQLLKGGISLVTNGSVTASATDLGSNVANSAGNSAFHIYNATLMTKGQDRYILTGYNDAETTPEFRVFTDGTWSNVGATGGTAGSGTGITTGYTSAVRPWVHKQTIDRTALTAAGTTDLTVWTTPVNTRIVRITADVTQVFTGGALTAVTFQCGNAAGGNQYLVGGSVFAAQTTLGDVQAEVGAGLLTATLADMGTPAAGVPGAVAVSCRFTCTTATCSAATQGSLALYIEGVTY